MWQHQSTLLVKEGSNMKKIAIIFVIILTTISCAGVPTGPLAPGELRLTSLKTPENIRVGVPYDVTAGFQANDPLEITRGCFYWTMMPQKREGPYCFRLGEIDWETKTIKVSLRTGNPNYYTLTGYVEYVEFLIGGTTKKSNEISTTIVVR
jgi:hypothetical protein